MLLNLSKSSRKLNNKWIAEGNLAIYDNGNSADYMIGPSEPRFNSQIEADKYVVALVKLQHPEIFN